MKKILFTAVSALALAAFADGVNSTEFGVMQVPSSAKETIVSVPWLESGTGSESVSVSNLVLTAGLKNGDKLSLYDSAQSKYAASWNFDGTKWVKGDEGDDTLPRGKALMLTREDPGAGFYIMGKPAESESGSTTALGGSSTTPAYSLIAPSKTTKTSLSSITFTGLANGKDYIIMGSGTSAVVTYTYFNNKWYDAAGEEATAVEIPAGQGFWFMSRSSGNKTVSW